MKEAFPEKIDHDLLRRIASGDRQALAEVYDRHASALLSVASRILDDPKEAEDVLQEVFLQIWDQPNRFDEPPVKPVHRALAMTRGLAIRRLRVLQQGPRRAKAITELACDAREGNDAVCREEPGAMFRAALNELPREQRLVMEMAFFGGMAQGEISASLNEPPETIRVWMRRGMLKLRDSLAGKI